MSVREQEPIPRTSSSLVRSILSLLKRSGRSWTASSLSSELGISLPRLQGLLDSLVELDVLTVSNPSPSASPTLCLNKSFHFPASCSPLLPSISASCSSSSSPSFPPPPLFPCQAENHKNRDSQTMSLQNRTGHLLVKKPDSREQSAQAFEESSHILVRDQCGKVLRLTTTVTTRVCIAEENSKDRNDRNPESEAQNNRNTNDVKSIQHVEPCDIFPHRFNKCGKRKLDQMHNNSSSMHADSAETGETLSFIGEPEEEEMGTNSGDKENSRMVGDASEQEKDGEVSEDMELLLERIGLVQARKRLRLLEKCIKIATDHVESYQTEPEKKRFAGHLFLSAEVMGDVISKQLNEDQIGDEESKADSAGVETAKRDSMEKQVILLHGPCSAELRVSKHSIKGQNNYKLSLKSQEGLPVESFLFRENDLTNLYLASAPQQQTTFQ